MLGSQKTMLLGMPRYVLLLIGLTSLLPTLFIGIRWPAQFGDISAAGSALTNIMTHVIHGVFLAACLYVAFDPPFSPRQLGRPAGPFVFLPFYYLGALAIGYCSGYFLLVFGPQPTVKAWQRPSPLRRALKFVVLASVWVLAVAVPIGLIYHNLPQLRQANGRELSDFVSVVAEQLPTRGAVVLSDDSFRLQALAAALARISPRHNHILVDTTLAQLPAYHRWLNKKFPQRWPPPPRPPTSYEPIDTATMAGVLQKLSDRDELYYLQPSFGYFFEFFYLKQRKAIYQVLPYPPATVSAPTLTPAEIQENDAFWKQFRTEKLGRLSKAVAREYAKENAKGKAKGKPDPFVLFTGAGLSSSLNFLGVEAQKSGDLKKAAEYFGYALEFNPESPSAFINLDYNRLLQTGQTKNPEPSEGAGKRIALYGGNWDTILSGTGPVDEPNSCFLLAQSMARGGNMRQAAQQLERVLHYNPASLNVEMALAMTYVQAHFPDKALELVAQIRARSTTNTLQESDQLTLLQAEASAYARKNDLPAAEKILLAAQKSYPQQSTPFAALAEIYIGVGQAAKAIPVLERQLQLQSNNVVALANLGALKMQAQDPDGALPLLDRCLVLQPQNVYARLNRAIAHLQRDHLDAAQQDYEHLELNLATPMREVHFGLGEIYARKTMTKKAIEQYEKYLKVAPPSTPEYNYVRDRLKILKKGGRL
jgi:tetratricopeptide (TPR) repeat protein